MLKGLLRTLLEDKISMTQTGDPLENAIAEQINKTIEEEFTNDKQINFSSIDIAKTEIKKFINFYNQERPTEALSGIHQTTPTKGRVS